MSKNGETVLPRLQEGGWGWVIVGSRFIVNFVISGVIKSMGVLVPHFMWQLDATAGQIGLCIGILVGLANLIGPIATALLGVISHRKLVLIGSIIAATGLCLTSMAASPVHLGAGLTTAAAGMGFCAVPMISCCTWYFREKFALINGLSVVGGSLGMMLLPPFTELAVGVYGWRATVLLFAAFSLNLLVAGAVIRRPRNKIEDRGKMLNKNGAVVTFQNKQLMIKEKENKLAKISTSISKSLYLGIFRRTSRFMIYEVVFLFYAIGYTSWVVFLIPNAIHKGVHPVKAALLSTLGGCGAVFGRITHGPLIDYGYITGSRLFAVLSFICAWAFLLDSLFTSYYMQSISAFIVGLCIGVRYPLSITMVTKMPELIQSHLLVSAIGWTHFFLGVGKTIGGPVTGWLFDITGDYNAAFITMGALELLITFILCAEICKKHLHDRSQQRTTPENV